MKKREIYALLSKTTNYYSLLYKRIVFGILLSELEEENIWIV